MPFLLDKTRMPLNSDSASAPVCIARAGRALRFVVGASALPELPFAAPDAPSFAPASDASLTRSGARFTLVADGATVLTGAVGHEPFSLDVDVGDAEITGFGEATGAPTRN